MCLLTLARVKGGSLTVSRSEGWWWGTSAEIEPAARDSTLPTAPVASLPQVYAPPQPRATLSFARVSAVLIAGAMPFGHHNHHAHNDPAQGIYAAASALGSM